MIKYNPQNWIGLLFHSYTKQVMRQLWPTLIGIGLLSAAVCYVEIQIFDLQYAIDTSVHSMLGFVLGLFLVFRTNTAYDRWWEGRKLWGALVNNTRNLATKISAFVDDEESKQWFSKMIPNYVFAMKEHLREGTLEEEFESVPEIDTEEYRAFVHKPNFLALKMYERTAQLREEGKLGDAEFFVIDKELKSFSDIVGACERIKNTPIPYSYSMYLKKFIAIYIISLPFGFVDTFNYWTIPVVMLVCYILVSVELIAEEIEDPFGGDENDLPTDDLAVKIRSNVGEILKGTK